MSLGHDSLRSRTWTLHCLWRPASVLCKQITGSRAIASYVRSRSLSKPFRRYLQIRRMCGCCTPNFANLSPPMCPNSIQVLSHLPDSVERRSTCIPLNCTLSSANNSFQPYRRYLAVHRMKGRMMLHCRMVVPYWLCTSCCIPRITPK